MEKEALKKYKKAEKISAEVVRLAQHLVKENAAILHIAEMIEKRIKELGAQPAFPVNISINEHAAHYTPDISDPTTLKAGDIVKVDIGVHVDGYIWDRAFTVCVGEKTHALIRASEKALKNALKTIKAGTKVYEVSEVVEATLVKLGFNPVRNLCGHGLERYDQHAFPSIPNGKNNLQHVIKADMVIAMEVFVTNGSGWVKESTPTLIYSYQADKPVRLIEARKILERARTRYHGLPFAKRWLLDIASPLKIDLALKQLTDVEALRGYPILKEVGNGLVAQTEETIIVK